MFLKNDKQFVATATDAARRAAAIADLTRRRNLMFWCACAGTAGTFIVAFGGGPAEAALGLCAAIQWMIVFKFESDLRLLSVVDRLKMIADKT